MLHLSTFRKLTFSSSLKLWKQYVTPGLQNVIPIKII